jgi:hypothetical protein
VARWDRTGENLGVSDTDLGLKVRSYHVDMRRIVVLSIQGDFVCTEVLDDRHRVAPKKYTAECAEFLEKTAVCADFDALSATGLLPRKPACRAADDGPLPDHYRDIAAKVRDQPKGPSRPAPKIVIEA